MDNSPNTSNTATLSPEVLLREKVESFDPATAQSTLQKFRQSLRESKRVGDQKKVGWLLIQIAMVLRGQRQYNAAHQVLEKARDVFNLLHDNLGLATVLLELSYVNRELVRNALALEYGHQAVKMFQEAGRTLELAWAYDNMAVIRFNMYQRHESMTFAKKARAIFMEFGSKVGMAWCACNLGNVYTEMGYYPQADQYYSEAVKIFTGLKHKQGLAWALLGLAMTHKEQCKFDSAQTYLFKAKQIFKELGLKDREGWCLLNEAAVKRALGSNDEAMLINKRAIQLFGPMRHHDGVAWGLFQIGRIFGDRGQFLKAWQTLREALNLHTDISNRKGIGWGENDVGHVYLELNDISHARECFIKARVMAEQLDEGLLKVEVDKNIARLNVEEGLLQKAAGLLEECTSFCQKFQAKSVEMEVCLERARYSLIIGELEKARDWVEAAESLMESHNLLHLKPVINIFTAEIMAGQNKIKAAIQMLQEALQLANKFQQRRQRAEALLGLVQLLGKNGASSQLTLFLYQLEKDIRVLSSRKLRGKYLFVKGLLSSATQHSMDDKFLTQGIQVVEAAGLPVVQRQLLEVLLHVYRRHGSTKEQQDCQQDIKLLLEKGPVDLHLIHPRPEIFDILPVSLTS
ncbi:MAG: tetratricopeptide repeat protein [Elusimicrobia bacterium]|nr:tetratricopeptide repeat protein [Candidatus Obscuribacterium magneticum]